MKFEVLKSFGPLLFSTLLAIPLYATASDKQAQPDQANWSYEGASGPSHWGDLSPEYTTCKEGKNQSPINIDRTFDAKLPSIAFDYSMLIGENIINNGHTIQINIRKGGSIKLDGKEYTLKQFHFHTPSENKIRNVSYPLEAHFVHANEENELAVVALLYQPGGNNSALDILIKNMPMNTNESKTLGAKDIELYETKKKAKDYFRFNGSLTTPPCTEGVRWIVMQKMPTVSRRQLQAFQKALKRPNNRPVQPVNARTVLK